MCQDPKKVYEVMHKAVSEYQLALAKLSKCASDILLAGGCESASLGFAETVTALTIEFPRICIELQAYAAAYGIPHKKLTHWDEAMGVAEDSMEQATRWYEGRGRRN